MMPYMPVTWNHVFVAYEHAMIQNAKSILDIAVCLSAKLPHTQACLPVDCVIGHSMGGLVALRLAEILETGAASIILIETNLRPAEPFYRNLLLPQNGKHKHEVMAMLAAEAPYYPDALKKTYQSGFDFSSYVKETKLPVHALYGDRGQPDYGGKIDDLNLDDETRSNLHFAFIRNACHFPMIENPRETAERIADILFPAFP